MRAVLRGLRRFRDGTAGSATVEFVIWVPFFFFLTAVITDAATLYLRQNEMWTVSRDTGRRLAIGQIDESEAIDYARENLRYASKLSYRLSTNESASASKFVEIRIEIGEASIFGIFGAISSSDLVAKAVMRAEPL